MSDYIARDEVLALKQAITTDDSSGNETLDVVTIEDILEINSVDVVERKKIDNVISVLEREQNSEFWNSTFRDGIGRALEILKKNLDIGE